MSSVEQFVALFRGRGDAYGSWEGGCIRQTVTVDSFRRHLDGTEPFGVYPIITKDGQEYVAWGCIDIDIDDLDGARNLQTILKARNIPTWVERTRKGYHVWCFPEQPVTAAIMRRALLAAHQVLDYPAKEVNPKQETLASGQLGNYVRLPYYGPQDGVPVDRYIMDDNDVALTLHQFLGVVTRAPVKAIESTAQLWRPPAVAHVTFDTTTAVSSSDVERIMHRPPVGKTAWTIWKYGPRPEWPDRSNTLTRLAGHLCRDGVPMDQAWLVLVDADRRWGKFHGRADGDHQLRRILQHGYGER